MEHGDKNQGGGEHRNIDGVRQLALEARQKAAAGGDGLAAFGLHKPPYTVCEALGAADAAAAQSIEPLEETIDRLDFKISRYESAVETGQLTFSKNNVED